MKTESKLPSKGSLPDAHRSQYYDIGFEKRKGFIVESTGKESGGKPQICVPNAGFSVLGGLGYNAEVLAGAVLIGELWNLAIR